MERSNNSSEFNLIFKYALKDLSRNYKKISSIIITLFISLFILSAIFTIEDSLKKELNDNAKALLGGDIEIDYNRNQGNLELVNQVKDFATVSQMIEFSTMISTIDREKNKSTHWLVKNLRPVGSLRVGIALSKFNSLKKQYDICLISEYEPRKKNDPDNHHWNDHWLLVTEIMAELLRKRNYRIIVALNGHGGIKERDYFQSILPSAGYNRFPLSENLLCRISCWLPAHSTDPYACICQCQHHPIGMNAQFAVPGQALRGHPAARPDRLSLSLCICDVLRRHADPRLVVVGVAKWT